MLCLYETVHGRLPAARPITEAAALMLCAQGLGGIKMHLNGIYTTICAKLNLS